MQDNGDGLERPTSFGYVDLDGFAEINNEYGHGFGDQVLESVIEFGEEFIRDAWEFNREYGQGDEFLVVMTGVGKESAGEHMEDFRADLEQLEPNGVRVTGSIGVATYPEDGDSGDEVIEAADQAMLNSEDWGGDQVTVAGEKISTEEVEVWFEEMMRVDDGDLVRVESWIDRYPEIRAAEIYNETKGIPNRSHIAGIFMSATKIREPIEGIVTDIRELSSKETRLGLIVSKSRMAELGLG